MNVRQFRRIGLTLIIGMGGAVLASFLRLPAAALIGAALATSIAAWSGVKLAMDFRLRDAGFLAIGLSLGSGVQGDTLVHIKDWAVSLILLFFSIVTTLYCGAKILQIFLKKDRDTAILSSSPGALSLTLAIASDGRGDANTILIMQSMRLFLLAVALPLVIAALGENQALIAGLETRAYLGVLELGLLVVAGGIVALALMRIRFPAAFFIGGMVASASAHMANLVQGSPPDWFLFIGFCITGSVMGSRFSGISSSAIRATLFATVISVGIAIIMSGFFALITSKLIVVPFGQVWMAYAPGGVEAMAAISLSLGFDPAFIAIHHLFRIGFLALIIPFLCRERQYN